MESTGERLKRLATGGQKELKGIVKPYDIAVTNNRVYITDTVQQAVLLFDIPGHRYLEFGRKDPGALVKPTGIAISANNEVFVCDVSTRTVVVYDLEGHYRRTIGSAKTLQKPVDVAIDSSRNRLYVVDTGGIESQQHGIHLFDLTTGEYLKTIGRRGDQPGEFNLPLQATVTPDGTLYVVDSGNFRVQAFHPDGSFKLTFGTLGRYPGQFARPKGIGADRDGNLYVVDTAFGNFQIFNGQGELLMFIGERSQSSRPGAYMLPAGITVDENGRIYVADQFFRKVDVYRPAGLAENTDQQK